MYTSDDEIYSTNGFIFQKIKDPDKFDHERLINTGRQIINNVDLNICSFLSSFELHSKRQPEEELPEAAITKLNGAPEALITPLLRYVNLSGLDDSLREKNIVTLAGFIAQRFDAVSLIAHSKYLQGHTDCFDEERHNAVLNTKKSTISSWSLSTKRGKIGAKAFSDLMTIGCDFQDAYLNNKESQNQPIENKLRQLGMLPALG